MELHHLYFILFLVIGALVFGWWTQCTKSGHNFLVWFGKTLFDIDIDEEEEEVLE